MDDATLDAIEARADRIAETHGDFNVHALGVLLGRDVPALVAEVRRLRADVDRLRALAPRATFVPYDEPDDGITW